MKNAGFTLIEIIAVLIILGILAAVATPKFMSIQKEARKTNIRALQTAMRSSANIVWGKAILAKKTTTSVVLEDGQTISLRNFYPQDLDNLLKTLYHDGYTRTDNILHIPGRPTCGVEYVFADDAEEPTYELLTDGC